MSSTTSRSRRNRGGAIAKPRRESFNVTSSDSGDPGIYSDDDSDDDSNSDSNSDDYLLALSSQHLSSATFDFPSAVKTV